MVVKRLVRVGNGWYINLDKNILQLFGISEETEMEVSVTSDGKGFVIVPRQPRRVKAAVQAQVVEAAAVKGGPAVPVASRAGVKPVKVKDGDDSLAKPVGLRPRRD